MKPLRNRDLRHVFLVLAWLVGQGVAVARQGGLVVAERPSVVVVAMAPVPSTYRYTCLNDLARQLGAQASFDERAGVFTLKAGERRVAVAPGVEAAALGARFVALEDEVVMRYGRVYVPRWFAREVERYLRSAGPEPGPAIVERPAERPAEPSRPRSVGRVCIDPGHGGKDPGAVSRWGLVEKDVVLPTAQLLAQELRARGFDTVLTRDGDYFVELEDRPAVATRKGADLFVAVHANAIANASYRGIEVFYWYGSWSAASAATRRESVELAGAIERACKREGLTVRNVRGADYKVLRYSKVPATLVEIGFLTNRADEQALRTTAYRQRVARAIAEGIDAYRKGSR